MASFEILKKLEKKYRLKVLHYPDFLLKLMRTFGVENVTIDLNKFILMDTNNVNSLTEEQLEATFVHEKVHETRNKGNFPNVMSWYLRYIFSRKFRFEEEAEAYAREISFLISQKKNKETFLQNIDYYARIMAGDTYKAFWESKGMCTFDEAKKKLLELVQEGMK